MKCAKALLLGIMTIGFYSTSESCWSSLRFTKDSAIGWYDPNKKKYFVAKSLINNFNRLKKQRSDTFIEADGESISIEDLVDKATNKQSSFGRTVKILVFQK